MGAGAGEQSMPELFRDSSSHQMKNHKAMIQTFLDRGYEIESQEKDEEQGAEGERVARSLTTVLKPTENFSLPLIKLEAREEFGKYFDDNMEFFPHDTPKFELKAFKKGADIKSFRDPWVPFDLQ